MKKTAALATICACALLGTGCEQEDRAITSTRQIETNDVPASSKSEPEQALAPKDPKYAKAMAQLGFTEIVELTEMPSKFLGPMVSIAMDDNDDNGKIFVFPPGEQPSVGTLLPTGMEVDGQRETFQAMFSGNRRGVHATVAWSNEGALIFSPLPDAKRRETNARFMLEMFTENKKTVVFVR